MRASILALCAAACLWAQSPSRTPVAYGCAPEDMEAAGVTCTASNPCPVYLEIASLEAVGGKVFLSGNLHTEDVTLASILLASEDAGKTWTEPHARLPFSGLEQIQFVDYQNGWIAGQDLQGKPHDAFFLVTRDGGKTWSRKPVFDETRTGIIQHFWFDSKDSGNLIIDRMQPGESGSRYERYESRTAGDTWTLLEVSARPMTLKQARTGQSAPGWRLRPDGPTRSFHIEQETQGKWRPTAVFPVTLTECKGAELKLAEPPPEEEESPKPAAQPAKPPTLKKKR